MALQRRTRTFIFNGAKISKRDYNTKYFSFFSFPISQMIHLTNYLLHSDNNPPSQKPKTQPSTSKKAANAYTLTCNPGGTPERHTTSNEGGRVQKYHLRYGTGKILFIAKHLEISKIVCIFAAIKHNTNV